MLHRIANPPCGNFPYQNHPLRCQGSALYKPQLTGCEADGCRSHCPPLQVPDPATRSHPSHQSVKSQEAFQFLPPISLGWRPLLGPSLLGWRPSLGQTPSDPSNDAPRLPPTARRPGAGPPRRAHLAGLAAWESQGGRELRPRGV